MKKKSITILVLIWMSMLCLVGTTFAEQAINIITAIEIKGNNFISTEEIMNVVQSKVGDVLDNHILQKDLQAVFDLGYFSDVQITFESYLSGAKVIFEIVENPVLNSIKILGTEMISSSVLKDLMSVKPGQLLNTNDLGQDLKNIKEYYDDQGLVLAFIDDVNITPEGFLTITINEVYIKDIKITGNEKTKDYVIRRELDVQPGDVFDLNQVQSDLLNIYNLGLFTNIERRVEHAETDSNEVNLIIDVEEKKSALFNGGGGYSTKNGWFGYVEIGEENLFGRAQRVSLKYEFGQVSNYKLSFYDPWAFGEEFSFGIDLYSTTSDNIKDPVNDSEYTKNAKGGSIKIFKPLAGNITGMLKFKYENTFIVWKDPDIDDESGDNRSLTLSVVRDTTDNPFAPTTGGKDIVSLEYAGQMLGGDYNYTKYSLDIRRYYPGFSDDQMWAFRLKGGFSTGNLPFHEEFKIGGGETLRGYDPNSLSGSKMLLINAEYRFPLVENLQGTVFTDLGTAWGKTSEIQFDDLKSSFGVGLRMNTPLGQIRLDYAFGEEGGMPHFSIGQTF